MHTVTCQVRPGDRGAGQGPVAGHLLCAVMVVARDVEVAAERGADQQGTRRRKEVLSLQQEKIDIVRVQRVPAPRYVVDEEAHVLWRIVDLKRKGPHKHVKNKPTAADMLPEPVRPGLVAVLSELYGVELVVILQAELDRGDSHEIAVHVDSRPRGSGAYPHLKVLVCQKSGTTRHEGRESDEKQRREDDSDAHAFLHNTLTDRMVCHRYVTRITLLPAP